MSKPITLEQVKNSIRNIPDYPKKGIQFKDLTTTLKEPAYLTYLLNHISSLYLRSGITKVVGIESRGFILGAALAARLGVGFVPIRKPGKLPAEKYSVSYQLEYGEDSIEIHKDALNREDVVLIHDDLLATGGTSRAAIELVNNFQPKKIYLNFIVELDFLKGREKIGNYNVTSLVHF